MDMHWLCQLSISKRTLITETGFGKFQDVHALTANHTETLEIICPWQNSENRSLRIQVNQDATASYLVRIDKRVCGKPSLKYLYSSLTGAFRTTRIESKNEQELCILQILDA